MTMRLSRASHAEKIQIHDFPASGRDVVHPVLAESLHEHQAAAAFGFAVDFGHDGRPGVGVRRSR